MKTSKTLRGIRLDRPKPNMHPKVGYRTFAHPYPPRNADRDRFDSPLVPAAHACRSARRVIPEGVTR